MKSHEKWASRIRNGFLGWREEAFFSQRGDQFEEALARQIQAVQKEAYAKGRRAGLEEAAKLHDSSYRDHEGDISRAYAAQIRALMEQK